MIHFFFPLSWGKSLKSLKGYLAAGDFEASISFYQHIFRDFSTMMWRFWFLTQTNPITWWPTNPLISPKCYKWLTLKPNHNSAAAGGENAVWCRVFIGETDCCDRQLGNCWYIWCGGLSHTAVCVWLITRVLLELCEPVTLCCSDKQAMKLLENTS